MHHHSLTRCFSVTILYPAYSYLCCFVIATCVSELINSIQYSSPVNKDTLSRHSHWLGISIRHVSLVLASTVEEMSEAGTVVVQATYNYGTAEASI